MKKNFLIILAMIIFFNIIINVFAESNFEDAKAALEELSIIENLDYNADGITRAEMIQIMYRMTNGEPIIHPGPFWGRRISDKFEDVNEDYWAYKYVETFRYNMIVLGNEYGYFRPDDFITYAEMITIIVRTLGWWVLIQEEFPYGYSRVAREWMEINFEIENIHEKVSISSAIPIIYQTLHVNTLVTNRDTTTRFYQSAPSFYERRNVE